MGEAKLKGPDRVLQARVDELEESVFEFGVVLGILLQKNGMDLQDTVTKLFTDETNIKIIRASLTNPRNEAVLERIIKQRNKGYPH